MANKYWEVDDRNWKGKGEKEMRKRGDNKII